MAQSSPGSPQVVWAVLGLPSSEDAAMALGFATFRTLLRSESWPN